MNNIYRIKDIHFTMEVVENVLQFLELKIIFDKNKRISVDIFAETTNNIDLLTNIRIYKHKYFPAPVFLRTALKTFLKVLHYD